MTSLQHLRLPSRHTCSLMLLSLGLLFSSPGQAANKPQKFLPGCIEVGHEFSEGHLVLKPVKEEAYDQTVFFIHNISASRLTIKYNRTDDNHLHPLWETAIDPDRWAAFATDRAGLSFQCLNSGYYAGETNCADAIRVCQYPHAKFGSNNQGNYWVASNGSKFSTRNEVIRKGVLLRWTKKKNKDNDDVTDNS